jgi:hypothetical protein
VSGREIALRLDLTPEHVSVIRARFRDEAVAGLHERPKSGRTDHAVAPATVEKIVQLAMSPPPAGAARPPRCLHACLNKSPTPFAWTKPADAIIKSHRRMLKRISTAVC